jgi:uncharacterized damage-inducible protein DinB
VKKILVPAVLAMAMCGIVIAQDSQKPDAKPATPPPIAVGSTVEPSMMYDRAVTNIEHEWVTLAEAMPTDKYDFAPTQGEFKGVRPFGEQVRHVAQANFMFASTVLGQKPTPEDMKKSQDVKGKDGLVSMLKQSYQMLHQAAGTLTAQNTFQAVASPFGQGGVSRSGMMTLAVAHGFDHYGQSVVYARMNGIVPPATAEAQQQQQQQQSQQKK